LPEEHAVNANCALPNELTIYTISELHPQCLTWIATDADADDANDGEPAAVNGLWLDAQAVQEVDAAGVQLLLSLSNTLARQQRPLRLLRPSAQLLAACRALGASSLLAHAELGGEAA